MSGNDNAIFNGSSLPAAAAGAPPASAIRSASLILSRVMSLGVMKMVLEEGSVPLRRKSTRVRNAVFDCSPGNCSTVPYRSPACTACNASGKAS